MSRLEETPVFLFVDPDTSFEMLKEQYEEKIGRNVSDEQFRARLPHLRKLIFTSVSGDGTKERNPWIEEFMGK